MSKKVVPLESAITKRILVYLNDFDECRVLKRHGGMLRGGEPDLTGSFKGYHIELEVKRPTGAKLTGRQEVALERWKRAGAIVGVVRSVDDVKQLLREAFPSEEF